MIKKILAALTAVALILGLGACTSVSSEAKVREQQQAAKKAKKNSLEQVNLTRKMELEEDAAKVGYVYLMNFGQVVGYYVVKGKVSSSGSQLTPEQDVMDDPHGDSSAGSVVVDGVQDDGTYGTGDPGIFFFTADGTMVHTSLDYVYATQPLPIDVPRLGGKA